MVWKWNHSAWLSARLVEKKAKKFESWPRFAPACAFVFKAKTFGIQDLMFVVSQNVKKFALFGLLEKLSKYKISAIDGLAKTVD
jgi:hypothetical protein